MEDTRNEIGMSWVNIGISLWLLSVPLIFKLTGTVSQANDLWIGTIIGIVSLLRILSPITGRLLNWINFFAGIWLVSAPFVLGYTNIVGRWNDVLVGLVVLAISLMNFGRAKERGYQYKYRHFTRPTYH